MDNIKDSTYFEEKIRLVLEEAENIGDIKAGTPDLFIPGKGKLYERQEKGKKVLYIGKDTNGWGDLENRIKAYQNGDKENIVKEIMSIATQRLQNNEHIDWWGKGKSQYWDFIFKLQNRILGLSENENNINEQITQSFAWGNSYLLQTLNLPEDISSCSNYKKLQQLANEDRSTRNKVLEAMLDLFNPDIIVILNWDEYITLLKESDREKIEYLEDGVVDDNKRKVKIEYYKIGEDKNKRHVIWTYHPRAMDFCQGRVDAGVEAVFKFMKEQKVI